MKRLFIIGFLAALLPGLSFAGPFQTVPYEPQPRPELYVFGYGGINWMTDFEGINQVNSREYDFETENGWGAGGGLGLRSDWLGGTRFEVEGFHRSNEIDDIQLNGTSFNADAEAELTGVSVNFVKELVWGRLFPYVGLGLGYGEMDVDITSPGGVFNDGTSSFLWQVIAGFDIPYTERTSLFIEYRFMPISDFDLLGTPPALPSEFYNFDDVSSHSFFAGFRFAF